MRLSWAPVLCLAGLSSGDDDLPDNQFETLGYHSIVYQIHSLATNYPHLAQVSLCRNSAVGGYLTTYLDGFRTWAVAFGGGFS